MIPAIFARRTRSLLYRSLPIACLVLGGGDHGPVLLRYRTVGDNQRRVVVVICV
ncbi:hypothetical protein [Nibrella saemangeumensis]|uniref:hypothetical protein n=1 Tax=Nibrella saemangeumensis TaxID=1084526 RepID=UPI0031E6D26B